LVVDWLERNAQSNLEKYPVKVNYFADNVNWENTLHCLRNNVDTGRIITEMVLNSHSYIPMLDFFTCTPLHTYSLSLSFSLSLPLPLSHTPPRTQMLRPGLVDTWQS
jgi:hypothetical protein